MESLFSFLITIKKIGIFFLFLGPLVFIHELGHFLFARLAGVRVETFSIGFGPKLLSFKRGFTTYALSLIPLGGYVKMFGDDPLSEKEMTPEEEKVAFTKKGKWARFWIVFGGPLANFIMAYFLFFALLTTGEMLGQAKFGTLEQDNEFYKAGARTGDVLHKVNDLEVMGIYDVTLVDSEVKNFTVLRNGEKKTIAYESKGLDFAKKFTGTISALRAPLLVNTKGETYVIRTNEGNIISLDEVLNYSGTKVNLEFMPKGNEIGLEFRVNDLKKADQAITIERLPEKSWYDSFEASGYFPRGLSIKSVIEGSAAADLKLQPGDIVVGMAGEKLTNFNDFIKKINQIKEDKKQTSVDITVLNQSGLRTMTFTPREFESEGRKHFGAGISSNYSFFSFMVEYKSKSIGASFVKAFHRTKEGIVKTLLIFKELVTGGIPIENIGGPISIGKTANRTLEMSWSTFFKIMAFVSINLGIINLFPIPVLDGGHIVFLFFELVNGGPLSRKKMIYAQQIGMSLLFLVIGFAIINDLTRH